MTKFGDLDPAEAARKSAEARRAKRDEEEGKPKGLERLRSEAAELVPELVRAAKGEGPWRELSAKDRYQALKLVLEYGLGKPRPLQVDEDADDKNTEEDDGFAIIPADSPQPRPAD